MNELGSDFLPIAPGDHTTFKGHFDGDNYTIYNLTITGGYRFAGLFGRTEGALIENVRLENASLTNSGTISSGLLIGDCVSTTVENCYVQGVYSPSISTEAAGGMVGLMMNEAKVIN